MVRKKYTSEFPEKCNSFHGGGGTHLPAERDLQGLKKSDQTYLFFREKSWFWFLKVGIVADILGKFPCYF